MNWKEHAHLFANGKFKIKVNEMEANILSYATHGSFYLYSEKDDESEVIKVSECTLIARPINDLTEREIRDMDYHIDHYEIIDYLTNRAARGILAFQEVRKLMDRGIYFGPQSHFETGEVIDRSTL